VTPPRKGTDFSRIKPSGDDERPTGPRDHDGRRALFTAASEAPQIAAGPGSVVISCSDCGEDTVLSATAALRHAVPSLHLPFIKRGHGSWMRCPACGKHTWVSVQIRLP
jgi:predicted RNA-binding Zn-ribbon protein involved in translation (DUF1610 family)